MQIRLQSTKVPIVGNPEQVWEQICLCREAEPTDCPYVVAVRLQPKKRTRKAGPVFYNKHAFGTPQQAWEEYLRRCKNILADPIP